MLAIMSFHTQMSVCMYIMMNHNYELLCSPSDQSVVVIYIICYITSGGGLGEGLCGDGGFVFYWDLLFDASCFLMLHTTRRHL